MVLRSLVLLLLTSPLLCTAEAPTVRMASAPLTAAADDEPLSQRQRLTLAGSGAAGALLLKSIARGRPPPLRSVLGAREEAALVEEAPPGTIALVIRAFTLFLTFLPVLLTAPLAVLQPFRAHAWFWIIQWCLARAGTAFIKWGQWAATRPDMFPERLCAALSKLHSRAPVHSFAHSKKEVEPPT